MRNIVLCLLAAATLAEAESYQPYSVEEGIEVVDIVTTIPGGRFDAVFVWPQAVGGESERAIADSINSQLSYETVLGESMEDISSQFQEFQAGITGSDYSVNALTDNVLDITITVDYLGAYPSRGEFYFTFDLENGSRIIPEDLFNQDNLDQLVEILDEELQVRIENELEVETPDGESRLLPQGDPLFSQHFTEDDLVNCSITEDGIVFRHEFGFPHAIKAHEPDGAILVPWEELSDYLSITGNGYRLR